MRGAPHDMILFELPIKANAPHGAASLKSEAPSLKSKPPFQEIIPRKNPKKVETVINICVPLIKQH